MKHLLKSFVAIFAMVLMLGIQSQNTYAQTEDAEVAAIVKELAQTVNAELPQDAGNGVKLLSCTAQGKTLIFTVGIPKGINPKVFTESGEFKGSFVQGLNSANEDLPFGTVCGMLGISMKVVLKNEKGQASILYTPEELMGE